MSGYSDYNHLINDWWSVGIWFSVDCRILLNFANCPIAFGIMFCRKQLWSVLLTTMIMLCSAVEVGVDMLELDCHMTKDGEVVVSHDEDLTRVTGRQLRISDTLFEVILLYCLCSCHTFTHIAARVHCACGYDWVLKLVDWHADKLHCKLLKRGTDMVCQVALEICAA